MGQTVLNATSSASNVRLYAHCGRTGGVSVAYLNLAQFDVSLALPKPLSAAARDEYILTAGTPIDGAANPLQSKEAMLNGKKIALQPSGAALADSGRGDEPPKLPPLEGRSVPAGGPASLPANSLGFLHFPDVHLAACGAAPELTAQTATSFTVGNLSFTLSAPAQTINSLSMPAADLQSGLFDFMPDAKTFGGSHRLGDVTMRVRPAGSSEDFMTLTTGGPDSAKA
eukprot:6006837-Prymnesium_polylepis.1